MYRYPLKIVCAALISVATHCAAAELEDAPHYQARLLQYEQGSDLAWAYRLAWLAAREDRPDLAAKWLTILVDGNWQMGVEPAIFDASVLPGPGRAALRELQSRMPASTRSAGVVWTLDDAGLIPESIAFDAGRDRLFVGSLHRRNVYVLSPGQALRPFTDIELGAVYGIKFDREKDELWVLHNPRIDGSLYGELTVFDGDGNEIHNVMPATDEARELNDLCLDAEHVYVTDSRNDRVLVASRSSSELHELFPGIEVPYANGIACNAATDDLFVAGATGIYRFDKREPAQGKPMNVPAGYSLGGIDGLYRIGDRLLGVQNALGASKVVVAALGEPGSLNEITFNDVLSPHFRLPTTGFVDGDCFLYVASSSLDALAVDESIDPSARAPEPAKILGLVLSGDAATCQPGSR